MAACRPASRPRPRGRAAQAVAADPADPAASERGLQQDEIKCWSFLHADPCDKFLSVSFLITLSQANFTPMANRQACEFLTDCF